MKQVNSEFKNNKESNVVDKELVDPLLLKAVYI